MEDSAQFGRKMWKDVTATHSLIFKLFCPALIEQSD
jgi:hypothetical protein